MATLDVIKETLKDLLTKIEAPFDDFEIDEEEHEGVINYKINIKSEEPSMLIGFHGENIHALQHLLKVICWEKTSDEFNILLDVDDYRKKQEENVLNLTERKIEMARKTRKTQVLPPMSPYFRRVVHLFLTKPEFGDVSSESIGDGDHRQVTIVFNGNE